MRTEAHTDNTDLAKVAVECSTDTFVVNQSLIIRFTIFGENRHLSQARISYGLCYKDKPTKKNYKKHEQ